MAQPYTPRDLARALGIDTHSALTHRWAARFGMSAPGSGRGKYRFTLGHLVAARCCQDLHPRQDRSVPRRRVIDQVCRAVPGHIDGGGTARWLVIETGAWTCQFVDADDQLLEARRMVPDGAILHIFDLHQALGLPAPATV